MNEPVSSPRQSLLSGAGLLLLLWGSSFALSVLWPSVVAEHCPLGKDVLRPDRSVCELAFGGTWISLSIGLLAGAAATLVGLLVASLARGLGRWIDAALMRSADALFALPDVLVLMVLQFAAQTGADLHPRLRIGPVPLMVASLAMVGWSAPARLFRDRLETLERAEFVGAAHALGAGRWQRPLGDPGRVDGQLSGNRKSRADVPGTLPRYQLRELASRRGSTSRAPSVAFAHLDCDRGNPCGPWGLGAGRPPLAVVDALFEAPFGGFTCAWSTMRGRPQ